MSALNKRQVKKHSAAKLYDSPALPDLPPRNRSCSTHLHRTLKKVSRGDHYAMGIELTKIEYGGLLSVGVSSPSSGALGI